MDWASLGGELLDQFRKDGTHLGCDAHRPLRGLPGFEPGPQVGTSAKGVPYLGWHLGQQAVEAAPFGFPGQQHRAHQRVAMEVRRSPALQRRETAQRRPQREAECSGAGQSVDDHLLAHVQRLAAECGRPLGRQPRKQVLHEAGGGAALQCAHLPGPEGQHARIRL